MNFKLGYEQLVHLTQNAEYWDTCVCAHVSYSQAVQ